MAGVGLGFAGVALMVGADPRATPWPAALAMLAATRSYGFAGLWGRRFRALGIPPLAAAAGQVTGAKLVHAPLALLLQPPPGPPSAGAAAALVALALLSLAVAYLLYFRILELSGPVNPLLVTLLIPPVAGGLGWLVLGERLGRQHAPEPIHPDCRQGGCLQPLISVQIHASERRRSPAICSRARGNSSWLGDPRREDFSRGLGRKKATCAAFLKLSHAAKHAEDRKSSGKISP